MTHKIAYSLPPFVGLAAFAAMDHYKTQTGVNLACAAILISFLIAGTSNALRENYRYAPLTSVLSGGTVALATTGAMATVFETRGTASPAFHFVFLWWGMSLFVLPALAVSGFRGAAAADYHEKQEIMRRSSFMVLAVIAVMLILSVRASW